MSTSSTTMSGVTHTPSVSYGHSRRPARGHNRSGNWTQIPSAVTIPPPHEHVLQGELHEHDHDDSHDHLGHNNGHIHRHSAEHQHTHSHTHSYSISGNGPIGITKEEEPSDVLLGGPKASAAYATPFQSTTDSYVPLR
jgi:zinc transporter 5/7